jgi:hypothetical protein
LDALELTKSLPFDLTARFATSAIFDFGFDQRRPAPFAIVRIGRQNYQATVDGKADAFTKEAPHVAADGSRFDADDGKSGYAPSGYSILSNRKAAGP